MNLLLGLWSFILLNRAELVGIPMVMLVDYLNKDVKSERVRFFTAALACFFAACFLDYKEIMYGSPEQALSSWILIFTESQATFKLYFKDSAFRKWLQDAYTPDKTLEAIGGGEVLH